jgi:hypothetical protein
MLGDEIGMNIMAEEGGPEKDSYLCCSPFAFLV